MYIASIAGWLFLPVASYKFEGVPEYSKTTVTSLTVLLCAGMLDSRRFLQFRPHFLDAAVLGFCIAPLASSLTNGLGLYDGCSATFSQLVIWAAPYLVGRLYVRSAEDARLFLTCLFVGGLTYLPLCWVEMRLSPQLHNWIYGFAQHEFLQTIRGDGYRPMVFMQHGLSLGLYMTSAAIAGLALLQAKSLGVLSRYGGVPLVYISLLNIPLLRSGNAIITTILGVSTLIVATRFGRTVALPLLLVLTAMPAAYVVDRLTVDLSSSTLIGLAEQASADRADSLEFRVNQERSLIAKAMERPLFGWGGWGRARVFSEDGTDRSVTDSLWIIVLGNNGIVGLLALGAMLLLGPITACFALRGASWSDAETVCWITLALIVVLYAADCCVNAMPNPIYMICAGGLTSAGRVVSQRISHRSSTRLA